MFWEPLAGMFGWLANTHPSIPLSTDDICATFGPRSCGACAATLLHRLKPDRLDENGLRRDVSGSCLDVLDLVNDIHSVGDFPKDGVSIFARAGPFVIQEGVVLDVDEKLSGRTVNLSGPGHRQRTAPVLQPIVGFVLNGTPSWLSHHVGCETSSLDHEVGDNAMKDRVIVKTLVDIGKDVFHGLWSSRPIELDRDVTHARLDDHDRLILRGQIGRRKKCES